MAQAGRCERSGVHRSDNHGRGKSLCLVARLCCAGYFVSVTSHDFRRLALALPEATESSHMGHPDFRVHNKIFATLWPKEERGVLLVTPEQQRSLTQSTPAMFTPVPGGRGRRGSTDVHLKMADEATVANALQIAWRNKAPKRLVAGMK
jgi:hypothetical protein